MSLAAKLSGTIGFADPTWDRVPDSPGAYVICDGDEVIYVGMAGRDGKGSLRRRLRDHASGQIVNMFAQYLFLDRVQFAVHERIRHPREAKAACRSYLTERCSFRYVEAESGADARRYERQLKQELSPSLNP